MPPLDLTDTLVVGISSTALFDLSESHSVFEENFKNDKEHAIATYRAHMLRHEDQVLDPGTGLPVVRALLNLNRFGGGDESPLVEVVVMSRNSPETGVRILNTIRSLDLNITRSAFTGGETVVDFLDAFDVDLFLTTSKKDAQVVIDSGACAAAVLSPPPAKSEPKDDDQVRFAFDGDAVLFDEASELVFKTEGIDEYRRQEREAEDIPLAEGPYAKLLLKLARLQERLPGRVEFSPVRVAIVTARNSPADLRVIKTLRQWGVYADESFFLGGVEKARVLEAFRPHIFFDDQDIHLDAAAGVVPSGKVPYKSDSPLRELDDEDTSGADQ